MKTILSAAIGALLALSVMEAGAQNKIAERKIELAIEQQSMADALNEWAKQTGLQLVSSSSEMMNTTVAPQIKGVYTAQGALDELLKGTTLTYEWVSERAVAIREKSLVLPAALQSPQFDVKQPSLPIARFSGEGWSGQRLAANDQSQPRGGEPARSERGGRDVEDVEELEEIVVTGTHIRGATPISPQVGIARDDIEKAGFMSIEDAMESLPQNFAALSPDGRFAVEGGSSLATSNNDRSSSIDLRGLGAESTLTLINGTRMAGTVDGRVLDVSAIPVALIERIEVITGAHSAIYGADAVGGVVNLITRRRFDGFETDLSYGGSSDGGERMRLAQLAGAQSDRGGVVLGYQYSRDWVFDLADARLLTLEPSPGNSDITHLSWQAQANTWQHSAVLSGHYRVSDGLELSADALFSNKRFEDLDRSLHPDASTESFSRNRHPADIGGATVGARIGLGANWMLQMSLGASRTNTRSYSTTFVDSAFGAFTSDQHKHDVATISSAGAVVDGPLRWFEGVDTRLALGVEARQEKFDGDLLTDGVSGTPTRGDRDVRSVFAELAIPIVENGGTGGLHGFEVSVAGRYDDYSDFGNTFNPQAGILWEPVASMRVRAGYSRAFRAPALVELGQATTGFLTEVSDPASPSGVTPALIWFGNNPNLGPENAKSWNLGVEFDLQAERTPNAGKISLSYFHVEYRDRIESPAVNFLDKLQALENEGLYPGLIDRTPEATELSRIVGSSAPTDGFFNLTESSFADCPAFDRCAPTGEELLAAFPSLVAFDSRTHNIAVEKFSGLDALFSQEVETSFGTFEYGLNATYTLDHKRFVTSTSPAIELRNDIGKPVDLRLRANVGYTRGAFSAFAYLNYSDSYRNSFAAPVERMSSWTTADLSFRVDGSSLSSNEFLARTRAILTIDNVLDRRPPRFNSTVSGLLYDSANANPFGRYVSLRIVQGW